MAELLGGPLHDKAYAVAYPTWRDELRFLENRGGFTLKPKRGTIIYRRFLANLYIYDRREEHEDLDSDT